MMIDTTRLYLRELELTDAEYFFRLNADPLVLQYTGDQAFESVEAAQRFLRTYDAYQKNGFGRWAVIHKETQQFLGWCGLKRHKEGFVDIGFRFFRTEWGKGYATEAAKACIQYGLEELKLPQIVGRAAVANIASVKVLEKIGMQFWKKAPCQGIEDAVYYQITN